MGTTRCSSTDRRTPTRTLYTRVPAHRHTDTHTDAHTHTQWIDIRNADEIICAGTTLCQPLPFSLTVGGHLLSLPFLSLWARRLHLSLSLPLSSSLSLSTQAEAPPSSPTSQPARANFPPWPSPPPPSFTSPLNRASPAAPSSYLRPARPTALHPPRPRPPWPATSQPAPPPTPAALGSLAPPLGPLRPAVS